MLGRTLLAGFSKSRLVKFSIKVLDAGLVHNVLKPKFVPHQLVGLFVFFFFFWFLALF